MSFQKIVGLGVFERQVKLSASSSLPELFGIQFVKVLRDNSIKPKQYDPLEFVVYFNAFLQMELQQKDTLDGLTRHFTFDKMCDCFTRYIKLCYLLGLPLCPTRSFCALLAWPPHNRKGFNARDFVPARVEVRSPSLPTLFQFNVLQVSWCCVL